MFVVVWCNKEMISDWIAVETREEAEKVYSALKATDDTWTVSIGQVIRSTDYGGAE